MGGWAGLRGTGDGVFETGPCLPPVTWVTLEALLSSPGLLCGHQMAAHASPGTERNLPWGLAGLGRGLAEGSPRHPTAPSPLRVKSEEA